MDVFEQRMEKRLGNVEIVWIGLSLSKATS